MYSPQTNTKRRPAVKRAAFLLDRERRKKQQGLGQILIFYCLLSFAGKPKNGKGFAKQGKDNGIPSCYHRGKTEKGYGHGMGRKRFLSGIGQRLQTGFGADGNVFAEEP